MFDECRIAPQQLFYVINIFLNCLTLSLLFCLFCYPLPEKSVYTTCSGESRGGALGAWAPPCFWTKLRTEGQGEGREEEVQNHWKPPRICRILNSVETLHGGGL